MSVQFPHLQICERSDSFTLDVKKKKRKYDFKVLIGWMTDMATFKPAVGVRCFLPEAKEGITYEV